MPRTRFSSIVLFTLLFVTLFSSCYGNLFGKRSHHRRWVNTPCPYPQNYVFGFPQGNILEQPEIAKALAMVDNILNATVNPKMGVPAVSAGTRFELTRITCNGWVKVRFAWLLSLLESSGANHIRCCEGIVFNDSLIWSKGYGTMDYTQPNAPTPDADSIYKIASQTKVSAAVMQLFG